MPQGRNIDSITINEVFKESTDGSFPVLLDIQHEDIIWVDNSQSQENGHLRLINSVTPVKYKGDNAEAKQYLPAHFEFTQPQEDGVKVSNTTITISAVDKRIIEVIRKIKTNPRAFIDAFYARLDESSGTPKYAFSKAYKYEFLMTSCTWDNITAQWNLVFDPAMQINVPKDTATMSRCPSINKSTR